MVYTHRKAPATSLPASHISDMESSPAANVSSLSEGPTLSLVVGLAENLSLVVPHLGNVVCPSEELQEDCGLLAQ